MLHSKTTENGHSIANAVMHWASNFIYTQARRDTDMDNIGVRRDGHPSRPGSKRSTMQVTQ